jgi:4-aminobutyrate aminotransferase
MEKVWPGWQGGINDGNSVFSAAALATLQVIEDEGLVERATRMGVRLRRGLRSVAEGHEVISDVRGLGLMLGNELTGADGSPDAEAAGRAQRPAAERDLLLLTCGPRNNVARMIPALVVDDAQIDQAVAIWADAVEVATSG